MTELTVHQWERVLRQARPGRLLGRLAATARSLGLLESLPECVHWHLRSAELIAQNDLRAVRWELHQLSKALMDFEAPVVVLKGGAYVLLDLPVIHGRRFADVDLLVSLDSLDQCEQQLSAAGWEGVVDAELHAQYFREWLQEIPPLKHRNSTICLDLHHSLLPRTDPLYFSSQEVINSARQVPGSCFLVPGNADLVLHSIIHLFRNGDFARGLADLWELQQLLRICEQQDSQFWASVAEAFQRRRLQGTAFFAFRYLQRFLQPNFSSPGGQEFLEKVQSWKPSGLIGRGRIALMDFLVDRLIVPRRLDGFDPWRKRTLSVFERLVLPRSQVLWQPLYWLKRFQRKTTKGPGQLNQH